MNAFIQLTHLGKPFVVQVSQVESVYENDEGLTELTLVGDPDHVVEVEESVLEIAAMLKAAWSATQRERMKA
jgi:hypothetical protein